MEHEGAVRPTEREIEVAYLVKSLPEEVAHAGMKRIIDTYLSDNSDLLTKLRLRQNGDTFELTKKVVVDPSDLSIQNEYTVPLSEAEFMRLREAGGREVVKDRYTFTFGDKTAELDVFRNSLEGLAIVEFEFASTSERDAFVVPAFCGTEVTQEDFIAGAYLAGRSYDDIAPDLSRYGYAPVYY